MKHFLGLVAVLAAPLVAPEPLAPPVFAPAKAFDSLALAQGPRWFSAWASAHNLGRGVDGLSGGAVRLIVRPTLSGTSLRVKLTNTRGNAPAVFAAAFVGARPDAARRTPAMEATRLAVNAWMRTQAAFDAVIDVDRLMSGGPAYDGSRSLTPGFACDDNVHPNAAGYRAMGEFVDPAIFATGRLRN